MRPSSIERGVFVFSLLASVVFCLGVLWSIPAGHGADEPGHLDYAGYIWQHGALPGVKTLWYPQATQHPFLYYTYLAAFRVVVPGPDPAPRAPVVLPYERRVMIDTGPVPDPMLYHSATAVAGASIPMASGIAPYLWRLSGLPLLVIVIVCVFRAARVVYPGAGPTAILAAAVAVLIPQLAATFATITNDQFAILFASAAFVPLATGATGARLTPQRLILSGILFCLGFLSKATVIGAFGSALFLVFFATPRPLLARLRDVALIAVPSMAGAGWWYVSRIIETRHTDFVLSVGAAHPLLLRPVPPDWFGTVDTIAGVILSWIGLVGAAISPGNLFLIVGAVVPILTVAGSVLAAVTPSATRTERTIVGAFLVGVGVLVALLLRGTQYSYLIHGRYLLTLVVPGALASVVAMRHLFGARARLVLAASLTWFALMGAVLLHCMILPLYHPPHDRYTSPDFVAYIDAGAPWAEAFVEQGAPLAEPTWAPRPEGTVITHPSEVRVRVSGFDPAGAYVAWVRVHPLTRLLSAEEFFADALPLGGAVMPIGVTGWLRFPIPRGATSDGSVAISAKSIAESAELAEVLVTRAPLDVSPATVEGGNLKVTLSSRAPERLPRLEARVRARGGSSSAPVEATFVNGRCDLAVPLPGSLTGPLELDLLPRPYVWTDGKLAHVVVFPAERDAHPASPGLDVVRIPEGTPPGTTILRLPGFKLVPGRYRTHFLDERSHPIPSGTLALVLPDGTKVDAALAAIEVTDPNAPALQCDVIYSGGPRVLLDRLQLLHAEPWVYDLGVTR